MHENRKVLVVCRTPLWNRAAARGQAANGCSYTYLAGSYNAQVSTANLTSVVNLSNGVTTGSASTTGTGTTGNTGNDSTGTGSSGATSTSSGPDSLALGSNANSLAGTPPGLGRYYFDGNGTIDGLATGSTASSPVFAPLGTYSVNANCTGTITLASGRTFSIVLASGGQQVVFMETDANGGGAVGTLTQTANTCNVVNPTSYAYVINGQLANLPSTTGTGSTGTGSTGTGSTGTGSTGTGSTGTGSIGTASAITALQTFSAVGTIQLNGAGQFTLTQATFDGANFLAPQTFNGLINQNEGKGPSATSGEVTIQLGSGQMVVGQLYQQ